MSKVWLITGSSRGLGRSLAEAVLAAGDRLVATARNPEQLADLVAQYGDQVRAVALDVTDEAAIYAAINVALAAFGRIDVVVNNAGYAGMAEIENVSDDDFRAQFETNFFGLVNVTRAALPILREQGAGRFIQMASAGARQGTGTAGFAAYQSAKFAVEGFSEVLRKEVAPLGIKVTIVEPGSLRTDWAGSSMTIAKVALPYQATVGASAVQLRARNGRQNGDPAKAAQAILQLAETAEPPLRLLLGSDAVRLAGQAAAAQVTEDQQWRGLSLSTDFLAPVAEHFERVRQRVGQSAAA
jgi:NAD(P)-dependent dehydrogenase (short-subunit alcohol dehydrogenase family)